MPSLQERLLRIERAAVQREQMRRNVAVRVQEPVEQLTLAAQIMAVLSEVGALEVVIPAQVLDEAQRQSAVKRKGRKGKR
ncbi:hypothetical protein FBQ95_17190 [Chloroflexi bacterium CFX3]|nr:hypothetical protein [Chloroflexi bacterium CFX3]